MQSSPLYLLVELTDRSAPLNQGEADQRGGKIVHGIFTNKSELVAYSEEIASKLYNFSESISSVIKDELENYDDVSITVSEDGKEWFNMYIQEYKASETSLDKLYVAESLRGNQSHILLTKRYIDVYNAFVYELVNEFTSLTLTMIKSRIRINHQGKCLEFRDPSGIRTVLCEWKEIILS